MKNDRRLRRAGSRPVVDLEKILARNESTRRFLPAARPLGRLLGVESLNRRLVHGRVNLWNQDQSFFKTCLRGLGVTYKLDPEEVRRIPKEGPLVVVCNHPYGMLDGVTLGAILEDIRPDFRLLGNSLLETIELLRPWLIGVNPFESSRGCNENTRGLRAAVQWVKEGGTLAIFPAGEVASFRFGQRAVRDPEWNHHSASLARRCGATVVPIYLSGRNSLLFQSVGLIHPTLRTLLLAREMTNKSGIEIPVYIGKPIPPAELQRLPDDSSRIRLLRLRTEILANRRHLAQGKPGPKPSRRQSGLESIVEPVDREALAGEVANLSPDHELLSHKQFQVFLCRPFEIPNLLREIGRLREISFRLEGEGSGKSCDLDEFDEHYEHLFLWDRDQRAVAGSYRVAKTDQVLSRFGRRGLYTHTLFRFTDEFIDALTPALELGRSFVAPDYQRTHQCLLHLWRGLTAICARDPKYYRLFGPVSISNTYSQASKALITQYLNHGPDEYLRLASQVRPRHPFRKRRILGVDNHNISDLFNGVEDVSSLISEIETDRKGLPVLLKHYLRMHTSLLSFNVDRQFSNCLDGLIITNLRKTDPAFLRRIMCRDDLSRFLTSFSAPAAG